MNGSTRQLKQHFTYDQQVAKLRSHGLVIVDDGAAKSILQDVNYYRLTAYGITLRNPKDRDNYLPDVTMEELFGLYRFDYSFRHLILALIEHFEIKLRSSIAYQLGLAYGPDGYTNPGHFLPTVNSDGTLIHTYVMEKLRSAIRSGKWKPFVMHHQNNYGGNFPIWVAVELFTFGMLSSLYDILSKTDCVEIAQCFGSNHVRFSGLIQSLLDVRNRCAHGDRLYGTSLMQLPATHRDDAPFVVFPRDRVFVVLQALRRVTDDKDLWEWFFQELSHLFLVHPEVNLSCIGFPANWEVALSP